MIVLVLEDEPFTAMNLMAALGADRHEVLGPTVAVADAMAVAAATPPELALLNIKLPDGSGIEAARELHRRYGCPSLFVSGSAHLGPLAGEATLGFLSKPSETKAVLRPIEIVQAVIDDQPFGEMPRQLELYPTAVVSGARLQG